MKMFRRLAALTVVVAMVLVMLPAAVSAGVLPDDVKGTKYEDAASLLCALEIMVGDGENFNPDNNVTRAEFAKILVTAMGLEESVELFQAKGVFSDVSTTEWYAPYVELAAQRKAINGYGDGNFGPNDSVTGYQAIKMGCFASGHNFLVEDPIAGYPIEYYNIAEEYEFLDDLKDVSFTEPMTRGQVAILISNILKADILKYAGASSEGGGTYKSVPGVNLLSEKHDVFKFDGLITANDKTGLFGASTLSAGEIQIEKGADVLVLDVGETDVSEFVGSFVRVYYLYDEESNTKTVVNFDATNNKNEKIEVKFDDIELSESTDELVKYYKDRDNSDKLAKIEVAKTPSIILNGAASSYDSVMDAISDAEDMEAKIEFLDYDGDSVFDVVSITAYKTYVVSRLDTDNFIVTDEVGDWSTGEKKKNSVTIDVEDDTVFATIKDTDGDDVEFSDLEKGDTLTVAASEDGRVIDVVVSRDTVEGTVNGIGYVDGEMVIAIDETEYKLTPNYYGYLIGGDEDTAVADLEIKIGKDYKFNLDSFGKIAWSDYAGSAGSAVGTLGFITYCAENPGADKTVNIRMYTEGNVNVFETASTVKIDGEKCKGIAAIKSAIAESIEAYIPNKGYYGDSAWSGVPVLYELDGEGRIKYIDTPKVGDDEDKYTLQKTRNVDKDSIENRRYYSKLNGFGSSLPIDSSITVIQLPASKSDINTASKYSVTSSFVDENYYYIQLLTTNPESYKSNIAIVARGAASGGGTSSYYTSIDKAFGGLGSNDLKSADFNFIAVKGIYRTIVGDDEEESIIIEGISKGEEVTYTVDPEYSSAMIYQTFANSIQGGKELSSKRSESSPFIEGDVVKVLIDSTTKYVTFVAPVFMIEEKSFYDYHTGGDLDGTYRYTVDIGTVKELDGTTGVISHIIEPGTDKTVGALTFDETGRFIREGQYIVWDEESGYMNSKLSQLITDMRAFKIMKYDADKAAGSKISTGTIDDIVTLEDATTMTPPSIVIMQFGSNYAWGMYIINL